MNPFYLLLTAAPSSVRNILRTLLLLFSLDAHAQPTLCQQIGAGFAPDIVLGTDENSVTFASNLDVSIWENKQIKINGMFVVNTDFQIVSCALSMGRNASIVIKGGKGFGSYHSKYFRCGSNTWTGLVAYGKCNLFFNHIEDASIALDIKSPSATIVLVANCLNRNMRGVLAENIALNAIVAGNTFDCSSPVNGAATGLAMAGIQLSNCPAAVIGLVDTLPAYRNTFKKHHFGVRLSNSTATIGWSSFRDNFNGVLADHSCVALRGASPDRPSGFVMNGYDIVTMASSLDVFYCHLDSCKNINISSMSNNSMEQVHLFDNTIHITNEPEAGNFKCGISLERSKMGSDGTYRNTVDRNHLVVHPFGMQQRGAIRIKGGPAAKDYMRADSNYIEFMSGGSHSFSTPFIDIDVSGAEHFILTRNNIVSNNTFATGHNRWALLLTNGALYPAEGNTLWGNHITGIGPDDGCCAVHAENAGAWGICSNTTDQTYRGFHFIGHCGKSSFGQNTLKYHNLDPWNQDVGGTGLFLQGYGADNAFLGDQSCQLNHWDFPVYPSPHAYAAILLGNNLEEASTSTVQKNEFYVKDIADGHQAPGDRKPVNFWFVPDGDCAQAIAVCPEQNDPALDEQDQQIMALYPQPAGQPGVEEWQQTRYLLAKLMCYPELATGEALDFRSAYQQSSAARFAHFDSMLNALNLATESFQAALNGLETNIRGAQAQIIALDAGIPDLELMEEGVLENRQVILAGLAAFSFQRSAIRAQMDSALAPMLLLCEQYNDDLPGAQVHEQNQRFLNHLWIQQLRGLALDEVETDSLHAIAGQCNQVAGRTRGAAAAMLPPGGAAIYWRENPDEANCGEERGAERAFSGDTVALFPNPCNELLRVQFGIPFAGEVYITDLLGRVVIRRQVDERCQRLDIPVEILDNGIYRLFCTGLPGMAPTSQKFVVVRA